MKISDLEFFLVRIERDGTDVPVRSLLVRLATDSGLEGWGEAHIGWRPAELGPRRTAILSTLAGRSIFDVEELLELDAVEEPPVACALEMASWDLIGRATGQPVCHLFGGGYRTRVPLAVRLPRRIDAAADLARGLAERGFHTQIVTSCGEPEVDAKTLAVVREAVGGRVELWFDAVESFDLYEARDLCRELEAAGPRFIVDPLSAGDFDCVAWLRRQTNVPPAVTRRIHGPADVLAVVRSGAAGYVIVNLEKVGGMVRSRKCAAVSEAAGVTALLAGGASLGIAVAAMLHVAASTPGFVGGNECAYHELHDDVLVEPLEIVGGMMTVPQSPGLGVEVDRAKVERYQVT
ncbi:MAG: mandelate racemase/muconate lactonizing enzyme family protein [Pirellulales bacterium]